MLGNSTGEIGADAFVRAMHDRRVASEIDYGSQRSARRVGSVEHAQGRRVGSLGPHNVGIAFQRVGLNGAVGHDEATVEGIPLEFSARHGQPALATRAPGRFRCFNDAVFQLLDIRRVGSGAQYRRRAWAAVGVGRADDDVRFRDSRCGADPLADFAGEVVRDHQNVTAYNDYPNVFVVETHGPRVEPAFYVLCRVGHDLPGQGGSRRRRDVGLRKAYPHTRPLGGRGSAARDAVPPPRPSDRTVFTGHRGECDVS